MRSVNIRIVLIAAISVVLSLTGCITRTKRLTPDQVLLAAENLSKPALLDKLIASSAALKTLKVNSYLKVTQQISSDQLKEFGKGPLSITGDIAVERPNKLRLQVGLGGAVTGAEIESDDRQFRIYIPHKLNAFGIGSIAAPVGDVSFPCSLRPNHILDALFVDGEKYFNKPDEFVTSVVANTEGVRSFYLVHIFKHDGTPIQELWYDRTDKHVVRKKQYTEDGRIEADVRYSNYSTVGSISFPKVIDINRPIEKYSLEMKINDMYFNETIPESAFVLDRPPNANELDMTTCKTVKR